MRWTGLTIIIGANGAILVRGDEGGGGVGTRLAAVLAIGSGEERNRLSARR